VQPFCARARPVAAGWRSCHSYDLHDADVLAGTREPWLAVDSKVVRGDVEFGIAQLLWRRLEAIQAQGGLAYHFHRLLDAAQLDAQRARAWTSSVVWITGSGV
jgi:streptomycin 6-kinase